MTTSPLRHNALNRVAMLAALVALGAVVLLGELAAAAPGDPGMPLELLILHTNDMHSRFDETDRYSSRCDAEEARQGLCYGGYARVAAQIVQARQHARQGGPAVLALNAGDTFQGSIFYNVFKWQMAASLTNMLKFDAMALGNHEFDDGVEGLLPFLQEVRSPQLAANLDASESPALARLVNKSVVLDVAGHRVGIIGYVTNETMTLSKPADRLRFLDEVETLTAEAERLHRDGVGILIALGHSGYPMDKVIAERVPHLDLVIGGHSHSFLYTGTHPDIEEPVGPYPTFVQQASGRKVPVVQAYAFTKYMGKLLVNFDRDGEIVNITGRPILLDNSAPKDPAVAVEVETWQRKLNSSVLQPLGRTLTFLDGKCRARECNLGNLVADALVHYRAVRYQGLGQGGDGWTDAPIGIQNGGNIRASIDVRGNGTVTLLDVMEVCPFENFLVIVYLRGDILLKMLEESVAHFDTSGGHEKGSFLQFSGLRVTYDLSAPPGRRVVAASARCGNCSMPAFDAVREGRVYGVITNDFLVNGGDGYAMLSCAPSMTLADITPYSALAEFVRERAIVYPGLDGRIAFVSSSSRGGAPRQAGPHTAVQAALLLLPLLTWRSRGR